MDILEDLQYRGLINQVTNLEGLKNRLKKGKIILYCGFDPTANSLHIGNLLHLINLKRFQMANHQPIILIGGGTGLIGDPSGKKIERSLNSLATVKKWKKEIIEQVKNIFNTSKNSVIFVDNYEWLGKVKTIDFLRDIGKYFTVPYMLAKESVKSRLESGISFTEFSYMVLQAFDFYYLAEKYNCELQIGGSDQWGNITAGVELVRKKLNNKEVFGLSTPLVTNPDGTKFGKTASGTIWLDAKLTSPYQFYQFWVNTDDIDVITFLKYFTFLSKDKIEELATKVKQEPEEKLAQKTLALEVTKLVHGGKAAEQAEKISQTLFYGKIKSLTLKELETAFQDVPSYILEKVPQISLVDLLVKASVSCSKRQAREDIQNKIININGQIFDKIDQTIFHSICFYNKYLVVKRGKKNYYLVSWLN
ncbi:MAG: tyrosine--tRNA ligase [Candidatus Paceibacterota bacterium]|jgi:tyrosyl-tRNA synthetase